MKLSINKLISNIAVTTLSALVFLANPLVQADEIVVYESQQNPCPIFLQTPEGSIVGDVELGPWLELVVDKYTFNGITISNVLLNDSSKLVTVAPGEEILGKLDYKIDTSGQETFEKYHLIAGIAGIGAQSCISHNHGFFNSSTGTGRFSLKAPAKPGLYQVRFTYTSGNTCEEARSFWNSDQEAQPSEWTLLGIIEVRSPS